MSYTNPDEAIVRLHHVARRNQGVGARNALAALARSDPLLLSLLLSRLTRSGPEGTRTRRVDALIFLDIAGAALFTTSWSTSKPLITQTQVAGQLTAGWALAFSQLEYKDWASSAHEWLRHAAKDYADRHALLDALVAGADQRPDLLSKLFGMAHRGEFRDALSGLLLEKINAAQGVELI